MNRRGEGEPVGRGVLDAVYARCRPGSAGVVRAAHRRVFRSRRTARWLFATDIPGDVVVDAHVADLTSVLLARVLAQRLRRRPEARVLELGAGRFAIPCGSLSRLTAHGVDAVDVDADAIASTKAVVAANGFRVRAWPSDLFAAVGDARYDLVYWNLPYHRDPAMFAPLVAAAPDHLAVGGELALGYNAAALARRDLLALAADEPRLDVAEVRTWRWNRHEVLVLGLTAAGGS